MAKYENLNLEIKCAKCNKLFAVSDIEHTTREIPEELSRRALKQFAIKNSIRFDCPKCGAPVKLQECEIKEVFEACENLRRGTIKPAHDLVFQKGTSNV